jgi:uncharacterized membrane protein
MRWSWLPTTLQADHLRFFTKNHSRPVAATINTATTDQGVDEAGSSLGADVGFASGAFFGAGGWMAGEDFWAATSACALSFIA